MKKLTKAQIDRENHQADWECDYFNRFADEKIDDERYGQILDFIRHQKQESYKQGCVDTAEYWRGEVEKAREEAINKARKNARREAIEKMIVESKGK